MDVLVLVFGVELGLAKVRLVLVPRRRGNGQALGQWAALGRFEQPQHGSVADVVKMRPANEQTKYSCSLQHGLTTSVRDVQWWLFILTANPTRFFGRRHTKGEWPIWPKMTVTANNAHNRRQNSNEMISRKRDWRKHFKFYLRLCEVRLRSRIESLARENRVFETKYNIAFIFIDDLNFNSLDTTV